MSRKVTILLSVLPLFLVGCADQVIAPDLELVTSMKKPSNPPPEPVEPLHFISIETSVHPLTGAFTCAVEDANGDGVGPVYCWGVNSHLSLGLGGRKSRPKPEPTNPVAGGDLLFSEVHLGNQFACAIEATPGNGSGPVHCWGWNEYGQLGSEVTGDQSSPVQVGSELEFFALDVGVMGACGLAGDGTGPGPMYCWPNPPNPEPAPVAGGMEFQGFATDFSTTCGIAGDGTAWCWEYRQAPEQMDPETEFTALAVVYGRFCGLNAAGEILCWGQMDRDPDEEIVWTEPVPLDLGTGEAASEPRFTAISPGFCALGASGQAYCWGSNGHGQIGDGTSSGSEYAPGIEIPTPVGYPGDFLQISDKNFHTCGIDVVGDAYCWGANDTGELGNGTKTDSFVPVKVNGQ